MTDTCSSVSNPSPRNERISTLLAFVLIPLSGFAVDIYIPSLPSMASTLEVTSTEVQLTISLFLISYGISQLFIGSVLDSFGRYKIGLVSLLIFAVSSFIIASTSNIYLIYGMRVVHGLTTGAIIVAKRAYFVDVYSGKKLQHYLSLFTIIWSVGPIVAPFLGGYLQTALGWESNFYFLGIYALFMFGFEFLYSGETLKQASDFKFRKIANIYLDMMKTSSFTLGIFMLGLAYCMVMVYNMTGPFVLEHGYGLSPVIVGYASLFLGFAWMLGGFVGKMTIHKPFTRKMFINLSLQVFFVITMLLSFRYIENVFSLILFAFLIHSAAGFTFNNYFSYCLGRFPQNAGIAGGLTGGLTYIIVSFLSYAIVSFIPAKGEANLAYSYAILIFLSVVLMYFIFKITRRSRAAA